MGPSGQTEIRADRILQMAEMTSSSLAPRSLPSDIVGCRNNAPMRPRDRIDSAGCVVVIVRAALSRSRVVLNRSPLRGGRAHMRAGGALKYRPSALMPDAGSALSISAAGL
jgi:hypothetical protein